MRNRVHLFTLVVLVLCIQPADAEYTFEFIKSISPWNAWTDFALDTLNNTAYFCDYTGVYPCDYSDPENPVMLDYLAMPIVAEREVAYYQRYLFVQETESVALYDCVDARDLQYIESFPVSAEEGFYLCDSLLFLLRGMDGLILWNISDPLDPIQIYQSDRVSFDLEMDGRIASIAHPLEIEVTDFTDPENPVELYTFEHPAFYTLKNFHNGLLTVRNANSWISVWDISTPTQPVEILDHWLQLEGFYSVVWFDHYVWYATVYWPELGDNLRELHIYDFSNPANPELLDIVEEENGFGLMKQDGSLVIGAQNSRGMSITSAANPLNPQRLSEIKDPHNTPVIQLEVQDHHVGIRHFLGEWRMIDATALDSAYELSVIAGFSSEPFQWDGNRLYLGNGTPEVSQFEIYSLDTLNTPRLSDSYPVEGGIGDLRVYGDSLAVVSAVSRMILLDVSDPDNIQHLGTCMFPDYWDYNIHSIDRNNQFILIGTHSGMYVIDISDPSNCEIVNSGFNDLNVYNGTREVTNDKCFIILGTSNHDRRLHVFDLAALPELELAAPVMQLPDASDSPSISGDWLLVPSTSEGVSMFDISDLSNIHLVGYLDPLWNAMCCDVEGDLLYVGEDSGLNVYRITENTSVVPGETSQLPCEFTLAAIYPNPFNSSTSIQIKLPQTTRVILSVHNVLGREVSKLVDQQMSAGIHQINFDPTALTSGIYFCQLEAGNVITSKKMVLLK